MALAARNEAKLAEVAAEIEAAGGQAASTFVYDGMGRLVASTDAAGKTSSIVFDDANTKTTITTNTHASKKVLTTSRMDSDTNVVVSSAMT